MLLNFPNNPTGYSPSQAEARGVLEVLAGRARAGQKILAVFDDAYFGLFYEDGMYRQSLFAGAADLHENLLAVKVDGPTKEDLVWGFRVGFLTFAARGLTEQPLRCAGPEGAWARSAPRFPIPASRPRACCCKAMRDPGLRRPKRRRPSRCWPRATARPGS